MKQIILNKIRQWLFPGSFTHEDIKSFCIWSKQAEWSDGSTKRAYIDNNWDEYIKLYKLKQNEIQKNA